MHSALEARCRTWRLASASAPRVQLDKNQQIPIQMFLTAPVDVQRLTVEQANSRIKTLVSVSVCLLDVQRGRHKISRPASVCVTQLTVVLVESKIHRLAAVSAWTECAPMDSYRIRLHVSVCVIQQVPADAPHYSF